ncbi:MAG: LysR family transcriptional regulator [Polyangiaceae bacterium]|nr:LysR family transcriptional regulator [Polyangiaceae bacterium]
MLNVSKTNLNLFVVLHSVLTEGSVTRAGKKLGLSQTAVSNALARLRSELDDPLVVRRGRGIAPTPRAEALLPVIHRALDALDSALARPAPFDPASSVRAFTLALTDDQEIADLPRIFRAFQRELPLSSLRVETTERMVATDGLTRGTIDVALGPTMVRGPGLKQRPLFIERGVLVVRRGHPIIKRRAALSVLAEQCFIDVRVVGDEGVGRRLAERRLREVGFTPKIACSVPHFFAAAVLASEGDAIAAIPRRFAERMTKLLPLAIVESPLSAMELPMALFWHERTDADPAHRYMRDLITTALGEPAPRVSKRARPGTRARPAGRGGPRVSRP